MLASNRSKPSRSECPKLGRSIASPGPSIRFRNGSQSAEWVGTPCTNTVGTPDPDVRLTKVRIPSISTLSSVISRPPFIAASLSSATR